jgi:hypothetical protein
MTINQWRRLLHRGEVALGDVQAARRGRLGQRVANRIIGRAVARAMRRVWR